MRDAWLLYLVVIVAPGLATATYLEFAIFTLFHLTMPEDPDYPQIGIVLWSVPSVIASALWVLTYHIVLCRTELEEVAAGPGLTVTVQ